MSITKESAANQAKIFTNTREKVMDKEKATAIIRYVLMKHGSDTMDGGGRFARIKNRILFREMKKKMQTRRILFAPGSSEEAIRRVVDIGR